MANIAAAQSGNFNLTTTWVGGVVPGSGDVAYANTYTVDVSDTRTVQAISNLAGTGITVGGTFSLRNGCNLTCTNANGIVQGATTTSCVTTSSLSPGNTATLNANVSLAVALQNTYAINHSSSSTLTINGNLTGNTSNYISAALLLSGNGSVNTTGIITGGSGGAGGQTTYGASVTGGGTLTHVGNVIGVANPSAPDRSLAIAVSAGTVVVTGNVSGNGAVANTGGTLTVNGTCQSGSSVSAVMYGSSGQITRLSGPFLMAASGNIAPVAAATWRWAPTQIPTYMEVPTSAGTTKRNLYTSDNIPTGNYPAQANVRAGTVYGPNLENTGTLAVPAASNVSLGIAVDNTTGTAVLTAANVRSSVGLASANLDTQLSPLSGVPSGRLANVATVDTTGSQIQQAINP